MIRAEKFSWLSLSVFHSVDTNPLLCFKVFSVNAPPMGPHSCTPPWIIDPRLSLASSHTVTVSVAGAPIWNIRTRSSCENTAVPSHKSVRGETTARLTRPAPRSLVETGKDDQAFSKKTRLNYRWSDQTKQIELAMSIFRETPPLILAFFFGNKSLFVQIFKFTSQHLNQARSPGLLSHARQVPMTKQHNEMNYEDERMLYSSR